MPAGRVPCATLGSLVFSNHQGQRQWQGDTTTMSEANILSHALKRACGIPNLEIHDNLPTRISPLPSKNIKLLLMK